MVCSMAPLRCPETCLVDTKGLHLVVNVVPNFLKLVFQVTDHILGPPHGFPKSSLRLLQCFFLLLQKNLSRVSLLLTQRTPLTSRQTPKAKLYHGVFSLVFWMELSRLSARRCRPSTRREESATFCSKAPVKL